MRAAAPAMSPLEPPPPKRRPHSCRASSPRCACLLRFPGSPLFFSVPKLAGYDVEIGRNFGGRFNYSCPGSAVEGSCVLLVSAQVRTHVPTAT